MIDIIRMSDTSIESVSPDPTPTPTPTPVTVPTAPARHPPVVAPAAGGAGGARKLNLELGVMHRPVSEASEASEVKVTPNVIPTPLQLEISAVISAREKARPTENIAKRMGYNLLRLILHPLIHERRGSFDEESGKAYTPEQVNQAFKTGKDECFRLIGAGADLTVTEPKRWDKDGKGKIALHLVCYQYPVEGNYINVVDYRNFLEELALTIIQCPDMDRFLNLEDDSRIFAGMTPLMYASRNGMLRVVKALSEKLALRESGINTGIGTALYFACKHYQPEAAMILIEAGANVCKGEIETNPPYNTYPLDACYVEAGPTKGSIKPGMRKVVEAIQAKGGARGATGESGCVVAGGGRRNRKRYQKSHKNRKQHQRRGSNTRKNR